MLGICCFYLFNIELITVYRQKERGLKETNEWIDNHMMYVTTISTYYDWTIPVFAELTLDVFAGPKKLHTKEVVNIKIV